MGGVPMGRIVYIPILFLTILINLAFLHRVAKSPEQTITRKAATPEFKRDTAIPLLDVKDGESPIALNTNKSGTIEMDIVDPKFIGYLKKSIFGVHLETKESHTELKLEVKKSPHAHAPAICLDNDIYTLLQLHFHAPAEHQLNGKKYALEAHFVHANKDQELAVIGIMFSIGKHNDTMQAVIDQVNNKEVTQKILMLGSLVPLDDTRVFRYHGSLTTPPYTKNVKWLVMQKTLEISKKQLGLMRKLSMLNGARDIQPLRKRVVVLDSTHSN